MGLTTAITYVCLNYNIFHAKHVRKTSVHGSYVCYVLNDEYSCGSDVSYVWRLLKKVQQVQGVLGNHSVKKRSEKHGYKSITGKVIEPSFIISNIMWIINLKTMAMPLILCIWMQIPHLSSVPLFLNHTN
jgi:hypothetical protein